MDETVSLITDKVREQLKASILPDMLTPEQLSTLLQLGRTTTYSLLRRGAIPGAYRIGSKLYRINTKILIESIGKG